jgi:glucokinase
VSTKSGTCIVGVDVGGTKTLAAVTCPDGSIIGRQRVTTPRTHQAEAFQAILDVIDGAVADAGVALDDVSAIGLAVAAVVDPEAGKIVATPNMKLEGLEVVTPLEERYGVPVALGNDVNCGTLGEQWLGAGRHLRNIVGMFVGTGIGGGVIVDGRLVRGSRELAGEIGHIIMQPGGPTCGCGRQGCLEAIASRTAIERDIRAAIARGRKTVIAEMLEGSDGLIRSKMLKKALADGDPVVTQIMTRASETIGKACLDIRHLLDPEVMILGGGVMEACGKFMLPIIRGVVDSVAYTGARPAGAIVLSELGDDAVVLGSVVLAQRQAGATPIQDADTEVPKYPRITYATFGEVAIGDRVYDCDVYVRGDGKVKKRKLKAAVADHGTAHRIGPEEMDKLCRGNPELVVIGMGHSGLAALTGEAEALLKQRGVEVQALPNTKAIKVFNRARGRKAALIHVTC